MTKRTALVTGASGLAGSYMLAHLLGQGACDIVPAPPRQPQISGNYRHISADLLDLADCRAKLGANTNVTHVFYLAITERADPGELVSANTSMFVNLVKSVEAASPALEHVPLSQGTRYLPLAASRRRSLRQTQIQGLSDRLLSYRHRRGSNCAGQALPARRHRPNVEARLRRDAREGGASHRRGLPAPPDRRRPLQGPYRPHRQRNPLHHARQYELGGPGHQGRPGG